MINVLFVNFIVSLRSKYLKEFDWRQVMAVEKDFDKNNVLT
jgi:hypothetical protein